jgi:hypothetical protein
VMSQGGKASCPSGFGDGKDVVADPSLGTAACACGCTKTADPDCQTGNSTWSGIGPSCSTGASSIPYSGGACRPTNGTVDDYDRATTIPPSGGACQTQATPTGDVASTAARLCTPDAACAAATCAGFAPAGFRACIASDGDVPCPPSPFSEKHVVAASASAQCSDCGPGCTFQGSCQSPKLSFYSDSNCSQLVTSIPADGTCVATGHANAVVHGLVYTATPAFTGCVATGTSTPSLALQGARTVCCRP